MKLSDVEKNKRLSEVFLKKSDREYYDLEITEDHQKLYDQYVFCLLYTSPSPRD